MNKQINFETDMLQINMFGEFSISNKNHSLTASKNSGLNSFLLIAYLLSNKSSDITSDVLIDMLWPEGNSDNPGGALRTLCYRTRKVLKDFFPGDDIEMIQRVNNIYSWNSDIPCQIDIYEFETCCHQAFREQDPEVQALLLTRAYELYKGEFLPVFSQQSWILFRSNYYGNLYIKCVNLLCYHLGLGEDFEKVLSLCNKALEIAPPTDETLHKQKLRALLRLGQTQGALDYYYSILSLFSQKYGLDITESMQDIYQEILNSIPNQYQTINTLEENLRQKSTDNGSFYCNFDIFQNIYQINLRSVRRSQSRHYLILMTLSHISGESIITTELKEEMDILHEVMNKHLRSSDVYTKSSICQFSLIIAVPNENGCKIVMSRLTEGYKKKNKHPDIQLSVDAKEIN